MILSSDTPSCVLSPAVLQKEWLQNKQWRLPWQFQRWRQLAVPYDISSSDHEERIVLHHQVCRELLYTCTIRYSQTINYLKSRIIRYLKFIPSDIMSSQCQILNICTTKHLMLLPSDTPSCVPSAATQQKKWLQCNQWRLSLWIWSYPKLCTIRGSTTEWMTTLQSMKITITNLKMKTIGCTIIWYLKFRPWNTHSVSPSDMQRTAIYVYDQIFSDHQLSQVSYYQISQVYTVRYHELAMSDIEHLHN